MNRQIYNIQDLFVGPSDINNFSLLKDSHVLQRLQRIKSFQFGVDTNRSNIQELGVRGNSEYTTIAPLSIDFEFSYCLANVANELKVGLNPVFSYPQYTSNSNLFSQSLISGFSRDERDADKRNFYLAIGSLNDLHREEIFNTGLQPLSQLIDTGSPLNSILTFINCYLNKYSLNASVGSLIEANLGYTCDNAIFYSSGSGIKLPLINEISGNIYNSNIDLVFPKYFRDSGITVLRPGDITLSFSGYSGNFNDLPVNFNDIKIQSLGVDLNFNRFETVYLGKKAVLDREINFPVNCGISITALAGDNFTGNLYNLTKLDQSYDFNIKIRNPNNLSEDALSIFCKKVKLNNFNSSVNIGDNKSFSCSFITDLDPDDLSKGIFMSGIITNPLSFYHELSTEDENVITTELDEPIITEIKTLTPIIY